MYEEEEFKLTPKQHEAIDLFGSDAMFILLYGGSRSTKTFTIIRNIVNRALLVPESRHAILRFRFSHVKASVVYDTFPKVMKLCFPDVPYHINKSDWYTTIGEGSEVWFGGLDDKERTEKILGNEYLTIFLNEVSQISYNSYLIMQTRLAQKCFFEHKGVRKEARLKFLMDENPPSRGHWTHKLFMERMDPESKRALKDPDDYNSMLMNPVDNIDNLPGAYLKVLDNLPKRKRDRFYLGLFGDENENALWTDKIIEGSKVFDILDHNDEPVDLVRIVIAVDPSGATDDEETNNDDIGIVVCGLGTNGIGYVLEDLTLNKGPATWGAVVAHAYERHAADRVIGETNYGGAMVEHTIRTAVDKDGNTVSPNISYKAVHASRGKILRAEPISALHETGKIMLVGDFPDLEDELLNSTTTGYTGMKSPNRLDAFVFAMTELFPGMVKKVEEVEEPLSVPTLRRVGARR